MRNEEHMVCKAILRCVLRLAMVVSILLIAASPGPLVGQQPTPPDNPAPPQEQPEAPVKVDIQPIARDDEIATRLSDIIEATEWFNGHEVKVKDGVVFLRGEASEKEYRSWAGDLARSTQDVVAVVNRMSVQQRSIWDMRPAFAELESLSAAAVQAIPLIIFGLVVLVLAWFIAFGAKRFADWMLKNHITNSLLRAVVANAIMLPVLLVGVYIVLRVSGLTQLALTVLGGTGIAGLIIGIAFRDIAENFLASVLISVQNPFRNGDLIRVGDHVGFVQRVSTRGTLLMTHDGNHVQVPNAIVYKSTVINYSANPNRRVDFSVGIGYDDSITKAQEVVKQVLDEHPNVVAEPESRVILDELGASTVNLRVFVWLDASKHSPETVRSSVMRMLKQALLREGISMPDEAREVIFPNHVPVRMIQNEATESPSEQVASPASNTANAEPKEEVHSPGEGNLESDAAEIQRQADRSWLPEEGGNLLDETKKASTP